MIDKDIKDIQLSFICPEQWNKMKDCEVGKFCELCKKQVYDFSNKDKTYFDKIVEENEGNVCGRFKRSQLANSTSYFQKIAFATLMGMAITGISLAQTDTTKAPVVEKPEYEILFGMVHETQAELIGGMEQIPKLVRYQGVNGRVFVSFIVDESGKTEDFQIAKGLSPESDAEALRVVKLLKFKPATSRGKFVKIKMIIPVSFKE